MIIPAKVLRLSCSLGHSCLLGLSVACGERGAVSFADAESASESEDAGSPPTFETLYARYFAPGTPGHCATAGCHGDPGHNVWRCAGAHACYEGMLEIGLFDAEDPARSAIADPHRSALTWINGAGGNMPLDAQGANAAGRAAIEAWVQAGCVEK